LSAGEQDINLAIQNQTSAATEQVEQIVDDLVIDFTKQISPTYNNSEELTCNLTEFLNTFQQDIITEESLNDNQIIELVMEEAREKEEGDSDHSGDETSAVSVSEGLEGLKKFVSYVEQDTSDDFNDDDLIIFKKYLSIMKYKDLKAKKQTNITNFFQFQ
jgi:hypothetical protein